MLAGSYPLKIVLHYWSFIAKKLRVFVFSIPMHSSIQGKHEGVYTNTPPNKLFMPIRVTTILSLTLHRKAEFDKVDIIRTSNMLVVIHTVLLSLTLVVALMSLSYK